MTARVSSCRASSSSNAGNVEIVSLSTAIDRTANSWSGVGSLP
ncbi:hypothetical protein [Kutzneria chonburiensis]|nr:hypothetical protein [Kutzneria chonburiensis]